jgi:hypothetical protein
VLLSVLLSSAMGAEVLSRPFAPLRPFPRGAQSPEGLPFGAAPLDMLRAGRAGHGGKGERSTASRPRLLSDAAKRLGTG